MLERAKKSLCGGVSSPFRAKVPVPLYFKDGQGSRLLDVDDNWYIDYTLGWGPNILGYRHPAVVDAVKWAAEGVHDYGAQHEMEYLLSERIQELVPCAQRVAYTSSGSEAVQIAWRLARAATNRSVILKFEGHYHGWMDSALISYHPSAGAIGSADAPKAVLGSRGQVENVLENIAVARWNLPEAVEAAVKQHRVAAVMMEPILCNSGCILPDPEYLRAVREICTKNDVLLIFDEVITGFRISLGGAQQFFQVTPDLATFGKAIGGGAAISALAGRRDVMELMVDGGVAFGGSFNGNPVAVASAYATVNTLAGGALWDANRIGAVLLDQLRQVAGRSDVPMLITGFPTAFAVHFTERRSLREYRDTFDDDAGKLKRFIVLLAKEGVNILPDGRMYVSAAHTEADVEDTVAVFERALPHV